MFEGLIEFIEQTVFSLVNQIQADEPDPMKQVEATVATLLGFAQKNPGMTRVLIGDALVNEDERAPGAREPAARPPRGEPAPERAPRGDRGDASGRLGRQRLRQCGPRVRDRPLAPVRQERLQARADGIVGAAVASVCGLAPPAREGFRLLPELQTMRLTVRLARPGMQAAMARFLEQNFASHLDRWSPPPVTGFLH